MTVLSRSRLGVLAVLTGASGLGSETLMLKLLDLAVGSAPLVAFSVVAVFILGMGLGSAFSARISRPFWAEVSLAVYNLMWLLFFDRILAWNGELLSTWVPLLGPNLSCALLGWMYAAIPAFLLGVTFPAVAERSQDPAWAYGRQALGALLGVLTLELLVFPFGGIPACLVLLVVAHGIDAYLLSGQAFRLERTPLGRPMLILVFAGGATGAFQGAWLLLAHLLFTPHWAMHSTVVASMVTGLTAGTALWRRSRWGAGRTLGIAALGVGASALAAHAVIEVPAPHALWTAVPQLAFLVLLGAIPIGALFPAFAVQVDRARIGAVMLSISVGNTLGVLAMGTWVLPRVSALVGVALAGAFLGLLSLGLRGGRREAGVAVVVGACAVYLGASVDPRIIARLHKGAPVTVEAEFRGHAEYTAVYTVGGSIRRLYQNGFSPLDLDRAAESRIAFVGAAYAPKHGRALVLGAGSGQTAGAIAAVFGETDVVDIGETVPELLAYLSSQNYGLLERPRMHFHAFDAVIAPTLLDPGYDLIILTVDPAFIAIAAKLYTQEYFESLRSLLEPSGVFVFWADATVDAEGIQTLWNTAQAVFPEQRKFLAASGTSRRRDVGYHFVVSSLEALRFSPERPAVRSMVSMGVISEATAELLSEEKAQLLAEGRLHPTTATHRRAHPAPSIVLGGYNRTLYEVQIDDGAPSR